MTNICKLLEIYEDLYCNKPIFLGVFNHNNGYLLDYLFMLDINFFNNIEFNYQLENDDRFPEKFIRETYFGTSDVNILKNIITTSIKELVNNNIQVIFLKHIYKNQGNLLVGYLNIGIIE